MKKLLLLLMLLPTIVFGRKFYFSTSGNDSYTTAQAQNPATPWQSLVKLNSFADNGAAAGDTFLFKRGDVFANGANQRGSVKWYGNSEGYTCATGTAQNPIVFTYYGDMNLERPNFLFPFPSSVSNTDRYNMIFKNVSYFVFDGLQFNDIRFPVLDKRTSCYTATGLMFGESMSSGVDHFTVKNCNFSNIGYGILANGNDFLIDNNTFTNFKSVGDTLGTFDIGADALQISGKKYRITNNYISGSWAYANPFNSSSNGLLGGALETINDFDSSFIAYNTFIDNSGGMEFGQNAGTQYGPNDDTFAYNFFINNSNVSYVNTTGTFRCSAARLHFWNNVVIENEKSRFTGRNNGGDALGNGQTYTSSGFIYWPPLPPSKSTFTPSDLNYYSAWRTFDCGDQTLGNVGDTLYDIKNNVIWNTNGLQLKSSVSRRPRDFYQNNIYHIKGSYQIATNLGDGAVLSTGERIINTALFTDTSNAFPQNWNTRIVSDTSYAAANGVNVGLTRDYAGNVVSGTPSIGIYQYRTSTSTLQASSTYSTISCNGGNSTVTVTATGGVPPYTGVGTFSRTAGAYGYTVTDAAQATSTTTGSIPQPSAVSGTVNWTSGTSTTITGTVTASGGTSPYTYTIRGTSIQVLNQGSNIFTGVPYGSGIITVTDANNCQATVPYTVSNTGVPTSRTFYVSALGNDGNDGLTTNTPWKTLTKVQSSLSNLTSGDRILFRKGDRFSGTLSLTGKTNLYFGAYGTGADPLFWGTGSTVGVLITLNACTNITFYGWNITDTTISATDRYTPAKIQNVFVTYNGSTGIVIRKCTMNRMGYGAYFTPQSNNNTVDSCDIGNLRMIVNDSTNPDNDYGGVPVQLSSRNCTITNNYFHDCYARSYDYTFDGGGVEFFEEGDTVKGNVIMYNTFYECNGTFEFGSSNDGVANNPQSDNIVAYNKIINNGTVVYISNLGQYATKVTNLQFYNNVILQTVPNPNPQGSSGIQFSMRTDDATAGIIVLKNNIIQVNNGIALTRSGQFSGTNLTHTNNIYRLSGGTVTNFTLDATETGTGGKLWTDTSNVTPLYWDYKLLPTAYAINRGVNLGLTKDFDGLPVSSTPDIGILEYQASTITVIATATVGTISCYGGTTTVTVTATGGTAPYTGTGSFTRLAGPFSYTVTDANGATYTVTGNITQPALLTASASYPSIACNGGTTTALVAATGGTAPYVNTGSYTLPAGVYGYTISDANYCETVASFTITQPTAISLGVSNTAITVNGGTCTVTITAQGGTGAYQYSLDGGAYQSSNTFTGVLAGGHTATVKDALNCTNTRTTTISQPGPANTRSRLKFVNVQ